MPQSPRPFYLDKEHNMAETKAVNPWAWQDQFGFSHAIEVQGGQRVVYCSGQTSVDVSGNPMHGRDMAKQVSQALDNLETVLKQAGLSLANVVRLNYYTTDMAAFLKAGPAYGPRLAAAGCNPSSTLLAVAGLFHPDLMIEIEATAVA
ncbi:MAG: RidA family protein [Candidatus Entotheonellia bacterium]